MLEDTAMAEQLEPIQTSIDPMTGDVRFHFGNYAYPVDFTELTYPATYQYVDKTPCTVEQSEDECCIVYDTQPCGDTHNNSSTNYLESAEAFSNNATNNQGDCKMSSSSQQNRRMCTIPNDKCTDETTPYTLQVDGVTPNTTLPNDMQNEVMKYSSQSINKTLFSKPSDLTRACEDTLFNRQCRTSNTSSSCSSIPLASMCESVSMGPQDLERCNDNNMNCVMEDVTSKKSLIDLDTQAFVFQTEYHTGHLDRLHYASSQTDMTSWFQYMDSSYIKNENSDLLSCYDHHTRTAKDINDSDEYNSRGYLEKLQTNNDVDFTNHVTSMCSSSNGHASAMFHETFPNLCMPDVDTLVYEYFDPKIKPELHRKITEDERDSDRNGDSISPQYLYPVPSECTSPTGFTIHHQTDAYRTDDMSLTAQAHVVLKETIPSIARCSRGSSSNRKLKRGCRLWEFIRNLLLDPSTNPALIRWENRSDGTFKLVQSKQIAHIWGMKKGNEGMNYEKLSRAMRYYYKRKIFAPVIGKRLVYMFGPRATGWRDDEI